jgi:hypothetical protein
MPTSQSQVMIEGICVLRLIRSANLRAMRSAFELGQRRSAGSATESRSMEENRKRFAALRLYYMVRSRFSLCRYFLTAILSESGGHHVAVPHAFIKAAWLPATDRCNWEFGSFLINSMTRIIPRGIRNNNPLNIRIGNTWLGERPEPTDHDFEEFVSMEYGLRRCVPHPSSIHQTLSLRIQCPKS